jgi:RNA polymerase sigma-70 factor (ECF subfamily)
MLFNNSRTAARTDDHGNLLVLRDQDRSKWDQQMIARGLFHLSQSATGGDVTEYHVQAGIAAYHSSAKDYASTNWKEILALYNRLYALDGSPVTALNRAVAIAEVEGPQLALNALKAIRDLDNFYLYHAVLGDIEARLNNWPAASTHFQKALELAELESEKAFLARRLLAVEAELKKS